MEDKSVMAVVGILHVHQIQVVALVGLSFICQGVAPRMLVAIEPANHIRKAVEHIARLLEVEQRVIADRILEWEWQHTTAFSPLEAA